MEKSIDSPKHRRDQSIAAGCAIVIVSDSRSTHNDISGKRIKELLEKAGHHIVESQIIRNETSIIQNSIMNLLHDQHIQVIIMSGGTGAGKRDVTVDTLNKLFEKELTGFGEAFRRISWTEIGALAAFSRATAGIINERVIFCLPGSPAAVTLALDQIILPSLGHLMWETTR
jgi:molybdenum cofactor biosynthesis protein B